MINIDSIAQALLVAEHLSFSRAAQVLGVRQSAVSRRVRALEDALGVSLFERDSTGVRLTDAGRSFLDKSRPALAEIDHAVKTAASAGRAVEGVLRIGVVCSVSHGFVRDLIGHYRCYHPGVALDPVEGSAGEHIARITERQLDIAFVTGKPPASHCDTAVLWEARVFATLPQWKALAGEAEISWDALMDEHFIVSREAPGPEIHDYIVRRVAGFGRSPSVERHSVGRETLMHMVALGLGITLASEASIGTRHPDIVFRPLADVEDRLRYSSVWLPGNDNPALRRFLSLARSMSAATPRAPALQVAS